MNLTPKTLMSESTIPLRLVQIIESGGPTIDGGVLWFRRVNFKIQNHILGATLAAETQSLHLKHNVYEQFVD